MNGKDLLIAAAEPLQEQRSGARVELHGDNRDRVSIYAEGMSPGEGNLITCRWDEKEEKIHIVTCGGVTEVIDVAHDPAADPVGRLLELWDGLAPPSS